LSLKWTEDLSVGIEWIDKHHQDLFRAINQMLEAMNRGEGDKEIEKTISFLEEYVETHFGAEEKEMEKKSYPEIQAHKAQHMNFKNQLADIKKEFEEKGTTLTLTLQVQRQMADWWTNHINKVDKKLGKFLEEK